jgi:hypothetical protein
MEIKGLVGKAVSYDQDYRRFQTELAIDPESVDAGEVPMYEAVSRVADLSAPTSERITGKYTPYFTFATPWLNKTPVEDGEWAVSMRIAHSQRDKGGNSSWVGVIQLKVDLSSGMSERIFPTNIAEFTIYEKPEADPRIVMDIDSDSDFGQPGSDSWDEVLGILNEAAGATVTS